MKTWVDGYTKVEVSLPWKNPTSLFGPFYPILNDVLYSFHSNQKAWFNRGQLSDELLPEYRYGTESADDCEHYNFNFKNSTEWKRTNFLLEWNTFCRKRRFYCVDLISGIQTGPWVRFTI